MLRINDMAQQKIHFFSEDIAFNLKQKSLIRQWIKEAAREEGFSIRGDLNFIFCSDNYLLAINREYLNHQTYTDIITFDSSEEDGVLSGDIFISIPRINENAIKFGVTDRDELHRVMIHGVLHLCGYGDKSPVEKAGMTTKENYYLAKRAL